MKVRTQAEIVLRKSAAKTGFRDRLLAEIRKSRRRTREVNLSRIQRHADENEVVFVPGKVLGHGVLTKKLTVGAFSFSESAITKIVNAGGRALLLEDFLKEFGSGSGVKIIG
ncbi:MAG: 50S ribosomal protein L18e [Candidatus Caldarchaeum sp.]|nr:50S ribosomal protein L18e [Candidatus Caldarchaeum sp.]MDW8062916.1 50S ribosomal protein L18e [Candidatus Caldarchaeum sp.]